ncbi:hypothetical protein EZS27_041038 [termite gut metagenome]|uniref:Uncharacterized protein n=1 Tax=termite gut metagenome TaxID=433724 RepID=A0A5J4PFC5_9ZZZZ
MLSLRRGEECIIMKDNKIMLIILSFFYIFVIQIHYYEFAFTLIAVA